MRQVWAGVAPLLCHRRLGFNTQRLDGLVQRLQPAMQRRVERLAERLSGVAKLYVSVDPDRPLQRGFARVSRADGSLVMNGGLLASGEQVAITFGDKVTRQAVIDGAGGTPVAAPKPARPKAKGAGPPQGDLF